MVNGLYIGRNALLVNQAALTVVSNNIANMNTVGYSKQRVNLQSMYDNSTVTSAIQQAKLGYGVDLESISRYRDAFIDSYYRDAVSEKAYYNTINQNALTLENLSNEFTGSGLSSYINSFFVAANNISLYPTDITMKTDFVQQASNLAGAINNLATELNEARTNLVGDANNPITLETSEAKLYTDEINRLLKDIATLNETIIYQHNTNVGATSGLLDQRDNLIDQLAEYIPIDVTDNYNGGDTITLGNIQLLAGTEVKGEFKINLGDTDNPTIVSFESETGHVWMEDVKNALGTSGKLGAILALGGNGTSEITIKSMLDNLDTLANELATQINDIQLKQEAGPPAMTSACYDASTGELKAATEAIFVTKDGDTTFTALNISVNENIFKNPHEIATAYVEAEDDTTWNIVAPDEIGNNYTAQAFLDLRQEKLLGLQGQTFEDFNTMITTDFGAKYNSAKTALETAETVYNAAYEQRESVMGVNIEEELVDMVKYQRAYEASARVFTVSNEILQTLVNLAR